MRIVKDNLGKLSKNQFKTKILILLIIFQLLFLNSIPILSLANSSFESASIDDSTNTRNTDDQVGSWTTRQLWTHSNNLNAIAIGDVDATHPGDEIVVAGESPPNMPTKVTVISGYGKSWSAETVYEDDWWIFSVAIGDVYPHHEGNEIVIVGWSTWVTMIYKDEASNSWVSEILYYDTDWLYDVAIGDLDPTHPGNEIVWSGDPRILRMLSFSEDTQSWESKNIWGSPSSLTPSDINVITIGDFNASHPGNECAVAGVNVNELNLTEVLYNDSTSTWEINNMGALENNPLEMVVGDFYSGHPGNELAMVSIQRHVLMIYQDSNEQNWMMQKLWQDTDSIQDIEIFDIYPEHPGMELVVAGDSNIATILFENAASASGWETETIVTTAANLFGVAVGEFNAVHNGIEFVLIQTGGKLFQVQFETSSFNLFTPSKDISIVQGNRFILPIIITSEGDFSSPVELSISNADSLLTNGITANFNQSVYNPPELIALDITVAPDSPIQTHELMITGKTKARATDLINISVSISVLALTTPAFNLTVSPSSGSVVVDHSTSFELKVGSINSWSDNIAFDIRYLPPGLTFSFADPLLAPPATTTLTLTTTSSTPTGEYFILITGKAKEPGFGAQTTVLKLDVRPREPDYYLKIVPNEINITINKTVELIVQGISLFGFDETLTFKLLGIPNTISTQFNPESFIPTANSTITLTASHRTELREFNITLSGSSLGTGILRSAVFRLTVLPEPPGFDIQLNPDKALKVTIYELTSLGFTIRPELGFGGEINITVSGLATGMTWNKDLSPVHIDSDSPIFLLLNLSNLDRIGKYELTITATSENHTKEYNIELEIIPRRDTDKSSNEFGFTQMIIIIIVFLLIIISFYKFVTRLPAKPEEHKNDEEPKPKHKKSSKEYKNKKKAQDENEND